MAIFHGRNDVGCLQWRGGLLTEDIMVHVKFVSDRVTALYFGGQYSIQSMRRKRGETYIF